jgi:Zn-finger nucleic acid-binding protein
MVKVECDRMDCTGDRLKVALREEVEIDYCTTCRGVWLDRGELDKIVARASAAPTEDDSDITGKRPASLPVAPPPANYRRDDTYRHDDDDNRRSEPAKRKGGFLSDLFDF